MIALFACLTGTALAQPMLPFFGGQATVPYPPAAGGGGTCPGNGSPSLTQDGSSLFYAVHPFDVYAKIGQGNWSTNTSMTICKLAFKLTKDGGDISTIRYQAEIWTFNTGTSNLTTKVASSDTLLGTNTWSGTRVVFPLTNSYSYTSGTALALLVTTLVADGANFSDAAANTTESIAGAHMRWQNTGIFVDAQVADTAIEVFWY